MEANQELLQDLECPICRDIMEAPIRVCTAGHNICDECFNKVDRCPICRGPHNGDRNYSLESLGQDVMMKCTNNLKGCDFQGRVEKVKDHVYACKHTVIECPLRCLNNCKYTGAIQSIMEHCHQVHPRNTFSTNNQELVCTNFSEYDRNCRLVLKHYFIIFEVYGEMFKCVWELNCTTGLIMWRIIHQGPIENASQYTFSVKFQNPRDVEDILYLEGDCQPIKIKDLPTSRMYTSIRQTQLLNYCQDADLHYTISINKIPTAVEEASGTFSGIGVKTFTTVTVPDDGALVSKSKNGEHYFLNKTLSTTYVREQDGVL
ncbi:hypothetical protein FQA39_LY08578 [Lamprigera yunnana]|nr:hypothetical protein FQA39_LY08578 [Lamprigera yunnana]